MITTASQAFTWLAGTAGSSPNPNGKRYAEVFRALSDLCKEIPGELPGPDVVAYALMQIGQSHAPGGSALSGQREVWYGLGEKLMLRFLGIEDPELGIQVTDAKRLPEAVWLWQMLATVAQGKLAQLPQVFGDPQTNKLFYMQGSLQIPVSQADLAQLQQQAQNLTIISEGLRRELRSLIEQLCPERSAALHAAIAENRAKAEAERIVYQEGQSESGLQPERPQLQIVKD